MQRFHVHRRLVRRWTGRAEHIRRTLLQLPLPLRDLVRVLIELMRQFGQRALAPLTAARATFALNAAECVRRVLFIIFPVPLPALSLAQAPGIPLTRLSEFARPPLVKTDFDYPSLLLSGGKVGESGRR